MTKKSSRSVRARRQEMQARRKRQRFITTLVIIGSLVVLTTIIFLARQITRTSPEDVTLPESLVPPPSADGLAWGPTDAPVIIEEFSDFQWPFCRQFATDAGRQLEEVYADSGLVRFEYKNFAVIGPESIRAAEAAACANEQGQFWPYHDAIFANQRGENQGAFRNDTLKAIAAALGLDEAAFNDCLDSDRYREAVEAETAAGQERGVRSTPTLFINGEKIEGAIPFEQLQPLIEAELTNTNSE